MNTNRLSLTQYRRTYLPYGLWTEGDGAIVIFNRKYNPIWRLRPSQKDWESIEPSEKKIMIDWMTQIWFYNDSDIDNEKELVERLCLMCKRMHIPVLILNKDKLAKRAKR